MLKLLFIIDIRYIYIYIIIIFIIRDIRDKKDKIFIKVFKIKKIILVFEIFLKKKLFFYIYNFDQKKCPFLSFFVPQNIKVLNMNSFTIKNTTILTLRYFIIFVPKFLRDKIL